MLKVLILERGNCGIRRIHDLINDEKNHGNYLWLKNGKSQCLPNCLTAGSSDKNETHPLKNVNGN
jgi:hypothetical protein